MEDLASISPVNFFQFQFECKHVENGFPKLNSRNCKKFLLPSLAALMAEVSFAEIAMGWNNEGIEIYLQTESQFHHAYYPDVAKGDSLELFFDTRDVKTAGFNHKFCHHFFFLPEACEGFIAGEITHFRTEDSHPLCNAEELKVQSKLRNFGYDLHAFIPKECLHGYDPEQFHRIGFTYRINRTGGPPQHFAISSEDYPIDQNPALWSSFTLIK
jgi:hypothetical protein